MLGPTPPVRHTLAVAFRFIDVFTGSAVVEPLTASIPQQNWTAYRSARDLTYRFLVTNETPIPNGTFDVFVEIPGGAYRVVEPIQVALPLPPIAHPLPVIRSDFLREAPLWPTRLKSLPPAETAVVGRIVSTGGLTGVPGLLVDMFEPPGPAPVTPYASADDSGDFVFRLPGLRGSISGGTVISQVTLTVEVSEGGTSVVVNPNTITVPLGRVSVVELTVP